MTASSASASAPSPVPLAIARSMLSFGIEASLAFCTASARAGLPSGSPPPSLAATVIARASFVKSLPRRASTIAFLCLIPAHFECPAMTLMVSARPGGARPLRHGLRIAAMATVPEQIFKAYDVRGLYGDEIDEEIAEQLGRAFVRVLADLSGKDAGDLRIGLGRDMRLTAPELSERYKRGMVSEGAHVLDAGQVGTEMLYFLVGSRGLDGGLMCTASHNPKAYTGAKLVREGAIALSGDEGIQDMRRLIESGLGDAPGGGDVEKVDIAADFHQAAMKFIDPANVKPMKVVVDGGNGMGAPMVGPLLDQLPLQLVPTYWTPDGAFPDHEPNPMLEENRRFIVDKVREMEADLGIAWDGDADRCFFVDDTGRFVDGDFLTAILAEHLLAKKPGSAILYDVRASRAVPDIVKAAGGTAHANRVGHAFFKTRMRDEGAIFGGEVSGHYYFHDFYNADSGTIPALLILEKLS